MGKRWNLILPVVVVVIVVCVVVIKRDDLGDFAATVTSVRPLPFAIAICCLFGRYFTHAFAYKGMFQCLDEDIPYKKIVPLVFSVTFANDCAPTAGTAGSVLVAAWSHKQGMDAGKSVSVVFLEKIGFYGGFSVVMIIGFIILLVTGQMQVYLLLGCIVMVFMIGTVAVVLVLGYGHQNTLVRFIAWVERVLGKILSILRRGPILLNPEKTAQSFHDAAVLAANKPKLVANTFLRFVLAHACDCCCFIATGFAFGYTQIPFLIAGYVAGFVIATFILQTIGAVEILIALILGAYGAPGGAAAAIALCYRGLIFWIPFIIGAICVNFTGKSNKALEGEGPRPEIGDGASEDAINSETELHRDTKEEHV